MQVNLETLRARQIAKQSLKVRGLLRILKKEKSRIGNPVLGPDRPQ
jgi:hypothetical protein